MISRHIWQSRYRRGEKGRQEQNIAETWQRIARTLACAEAEPAPWEERFYSLLDNFQFLPGGRIQAGAGVGRRVTLFNCFVMGVIADDMEAIFDHLKEAALTMQQGGGVGYDFSTLRPRGSAAHSTGRIASGVVSFMRVWDAMCATVLSTGERRGAMMATLRCDHPDVEDFVAAKHRPGELTHFNLSVQITDRFMEAVAADKSWPLVFPLDDGEPDGGEIVERRWTGRDRPVACRVIRQVAARELWDTIMRSTYERSEPGVLFVDRINDYNNLWYSEHITATNPCGEIPLPPYGACNLGSINLTRFVNDPFAANAKLDLAAIDRTARVAVRMLDDVIDVSRFPLPRQEENARRSRRIGLGLTGLGDALILLGLHYGSREARRLAHQIMRAICHAAYRASIELAKEKGAFPGFDRRRYLEGRFVAALPEDIRAGIDRHGIRNSHLLAIAPTGTISLLAGNVSSGIEPVFSFEHARTMRSGADGEVTFQLQDYAYQLWNQRSAASQVLPDAFVAATSLPPRAHLEMQAALQPWVDNAISKTINVPEDFPFAEFRTLYQEAHRLGLKGCTTFRPNPVTGVVLEAAATGKAEIAPPVHCCTIDREAD